MSIERLAAVSLLALLDREDPGRPDRLGGVRTPIGVDADGAAIFLDLLDPRRGGDGEHGLLIGTAGAGRPDLLRAVVLGLAAKHTPQNLQMALIDGTGGGTFNPVLALPHVVGAVTAVAADRELAGRVVAGITEELDRRMTAVTAGSPDAPLSRYPGGTLLIVIDGGDTLIKAWPEFSDLVVTIGRIGRRVGVNLLLSCERLDSGASMSRLDVMLPVRLALRTASEAESWVSIGSPDAAHLPVDEHHGLLRATSDPPVRFRCASVTTAQIDVLTRRLATAGPPFRPPFRPLWSAAVPIELGQRFPRVRHFMATVLLGDGTLEQELVDYVQGAWDKGAVRTVIADIRALLADPEVTDDAIDTFVLDNARRFVAESGRRTLEHVADRIQQLLDDAPAPHPLTLRAPTLAAFMAEFTTRRGDLDALVRAGAVSAGTDVAAQSVQEGAELLRDSALTDRDLATFVRSQSWWLLGDSGRRTVEQIVAALCRSAAPLGHDEAKVLAEMFLDQAVRPAHQVEIVIVDRHTQESETTWAFVYNNRDYVETGSFLDMIVGNAPILVDKSTGRTRAGRSDLSVAEQI